MRRRLARVTTRRHRATAKWAAWPEHMLDEEDLLDNYNLRNYLHKIQNFNIYLSNILNILLIIISFQTYNGIIILILTYQISLTFYLLLNHPKLIMASKISPHLLLRTCRWRNDEGRLLDAWLRLAEARHCNKASSVSNLLSFKY